MFAVYNTRAVVATGACTFLGTIKFAIGSMVPKVTCGTLLHVAGLRCNRELACSCRCRTPTNRPSSTAAYMLYYSLIRTHNCASIDIKHSNIQMLNTSLMMTLIFKYSS